MSDVYDPDNIFWIETIADILEGLDIDPPLKQIEAIAAGVADAASCRAEAVGVPSWGARFAEVQREHEKVVKALVMDVERQAEIGLRDVSALTGIPVNDLDRVETLSGPRWVSR